MPAPPDAKARPHPFRIAQDAARVPSAVRAPAIRYVELETTTNFTFLTGASHPDEMVERAAALGHAAASIADVNTLAGVVRAHVAAKEAGLPLVVGSRLVLRDGLSLVVYPEDRAAYSRLCRLLTLGKRRVEKGCCDLGLEDVEEYAEGMLAIAAPPRRVDDGFVESLRRLRGIFDDDRLSLAARRGYMQDDESRLRSLAALAREERVALVATNDAHQHVPRRRLLQDVVTCIRLGCTIEEAGRRLHQNAERHLKPAEEMARLFADHPGAIRRTVEIAERG
ncbi:MAG: PHP domain-containing protein, partial [Planctomycetota bacterium]|nr:PHP domain-containing protein [Planctomycetota bacterium]